MIVETKLALWEVDVDAKRIRFAGAVKKPDKSDPAYAFFNADMQPHCYAEATKDRDGWVSCSRVDPPEVGKKLVVVYLSGIGMASSIVQAVTP